MAKASVHIRRTRTTTRIKTTTRSRTSKNSSGKKGNQNRCPSCGRYL